MKTGTVKWIISGLVTAIGLLGGFVGVNSKDVSGLIRDMATQTKDNDIQYQKIEKNTEKLNDVKGDIKENKVHLVHIRKSIDKIETMLSTSYSRQR